jgi:hypothetical protein
MDRTPAKDALIDSFLPCNKREDFSTTYIKKMGKIFNQARIVRFGHVLTLQQKGRNLWKIWPVCFIKKRYIVLCEIYVL